MKFRKTLMTLSLILLTSCTGLEEFNNGLNNLNNKLGSINKKLGNSSANSSSLSIDFTKKIKESDFSKIGKFEKFNLKYNTDVHNSLEYDIVYFNKTGNEQVLEVIVYFKDKDGDFHKNYLENTSAATYGVFGWFVEPNTGLNKGKFKTGSKFDYIPKDWKYEKTEITIYIKKGFVGAKVLKKLILK